jgi:peptidoglycan hydrolase CwlO-like protein
VRTTGRAAAALAAALVLVLAPAAPAAPAGAAGSSVAEAQAAARQAAAEVEALRPRVQRALRAYERSLDELAGRVSRRISAQQDAETAARVARDGRRSAGQQVRSLYIAGGATALLASVLSAPDASEALARAAYVQRLVSAGDRAADDAAATARALADRAASLQASTERAVVTASTVTRRYERLTGLLADAGARLARLSGRARRLAEAQAAAASLRALAASAAASAAARVSTAHASGIPADFRALYVAAAPTCPGLSWTVLGAIGQVESGHGRNAATSYAGAQGPMQFLPSTFAAYAVDGDHDGDADIQDPADAIFTAARYLCANGAGRGGSSLYQAIWHYNHADWYVQLVLRLAAELASPSGAAASGG